MDRISKTMEKEGWVKVTQTVNGKVKIIAFIKSGLLINYKDIQDVHYKTQRRKK